MEPGWQLTVRFERTATYPSWQMHLPDTHSELAAEQLIWEQTSTQYQYFCKETVPATQSGGLLPAAHWQKASLLVVATQTVPLGELGHPKAFPETAHLLY